jgi:P2 family phage contractile tail tube protein
MTNQVPEKLIAYRVYRDAIDLIGIADVELPDLEAMTDTIKGAGIAGEFDSPTIGHYGSMTLKLSWRTLVQPVAFLSQQKSHALDIRGAVQTLDAGSGNYIVVPLKISVRVTPKNTALGKLDIGAKMDSSNEFEVSYLKVTINNIDVIEIDKFNYIAKIAGEDALDAVREALGLV